MMKRNIVVEGNNITTVWLKAVDHLLEKGTEQLTHFTIRMNAFDEGSPLEYLEARLILDKELEKYGPCITNANANLLFPTSAWKIQRERGSSPLAFFDHYHNELLPHLKKQDKRNSSGTYFDRMIAYPHGDKTINQLGRLLQLWTGNGLHRQSAYQVLVYAPAKDLDGSPYMSFPCLDYLAFTHENGELFLSAFYANQLIFSRGYGNYLGLCRLGHFMAEQMGLTFAQLSCHIGSAKLWGKSSSGSSAAQLKKKDIGEIAYAMQNTIPNGTVRKTA